VIDGHVENISRDGVNISREALFLVPSLLIVGPTFTNGIAIVADIRAYARDSRASLNFYSVHP
jgi:hypothetical protein